MEITTEQLSLETLVKEADLVLSNDYSEVCKYLCPLCNKLVDRLRTHMKRYHMDTVNKDQIPKQNYHKEIYHKCNICDQIIIFTRTKVRNHIIHTHKMLINEYDAKFMETQKVITEKHFSHLPDDLGDLVLSNDYSEVCKYLCPLCSKLVDRLRTHMIRYHMDTVNKDQIPKQSYYKEIYHKCGICDKIIIFTREKIKNHIMYAHKMALDVYNSQFMKLRKLKTKNPKKSRIKIRNIGIRNIEADILGDLVLSNDYSEVCKYLCDLCNKLVYSLRTHMLKYHQDTVNENQIPKKNNYHKKIYHKCGVCDKIIIFIKDKIKNHIMKAHKMSINVYDSQFMKRKKSKTKKPPKSRMNSPTFSKILGDGYVYNKNKDESLLVNSYSDLCKVMCSVCGKNIDLELFSFHLSKKHGLTLPNYKENHGMPVVARRSFHKCGICGFVVLFTRLKITHHVIKEHQLSMKDYARQFIKRINKTPAIFEVSKNDEDSNVMYSNDYKDECKAVCKVCNKECIYGNLKQHIYQRHKNSKADYSDQFGPVDLSNEVYHKCAICDKTLLLCRHKIASHVKIVHKMSPKEYNRKYMLINNLEYTTPKKGCQKALKWCDGTRYRCPICNNIYFRYFTFRIHLIRIHEMKNGKERSRMMRNGEVFTDTYTCKICSHVMKKDRMGIEAHIKDFHKTTYKVYEDNLESGKVEDVVAVVAKLIREGIVYMPDKFPQRKKLGRFEEKAPGTSYLWTEDAESASEVSQPKEDDCKNMEMDSRAYRPFKKNIRLSEFKLRLKNDVLDELIKGEKVEMSTSIKDQMSSINQLKPFTNIKSDNSPQKKAPLNSKLNKVNNNINKTPSNNIYEHVTKNYFREKHFEASQEAATEMYNCPVPGCGWICSREAIRKGPAVLHLLRIHRIPLIEMRKREIKLVLV